MIEGVQEAPGSGSLSVDPVQMLTDKSTRLHSRNPDPRRDTYWHGNSFQKGTMLRTTLPLMFLILVVGLPVVEAGEAFYGQLLFAMLSILFIGTMVNALLDRPQDDR